MIRVRVSFMETYKNMNEAINMSIPRPVVIKAKPVDEANYSVRKFISAGLLTLFVGLLTVQAGFVIKASAEGNPITSPITAEESASPSPSASASPSASPSEAPITSPEVSPSPSVSPSASPEAPITAPEVTPTPAPSSEPNNGGNNNGGNSGGGSSSSSNGGGAPSCGNEAPKAPRIVNAATTGKNEITLYWDKANGPVSHYSVSFGLFRGKPQYGVTNVGNVTSYKVKGLVPGLTYYFTVNAVNECAAGASSNEVAMKVGGKFINIAPVNTKTAASNSGKTVLGSKLLPTKFSPIPVAKPVVFGPTVQANTGLLGKVASFFKGWF